jgi:UDP-N-acetylglucosamine 2-epimerase (non-hydrolysing)
VTVTHGTNRLAGTTSDGIRKTIATVLAADRMIVAPPPLWDGRASERIAETLETWGRSR